MKMINFLSWMFCVLVSIKLGDSTLPDIDHLLQNANSTSQHLTSWIAEASAPEQSQYMRSPTEYVPDISGLLAKYYIGSRHAAPPYGSPHFMGLESYPKRLAYHPSVDYRSTQYQDQQAMHSMPEYDMSPMRKHDYGPNSGGWDMVSGGGGGGFNFGHGGSGQGLAQVGQAVKKGKEAKALFLLMAPLILLAVFGPILATQAVMPWVANGGLASVSTIATGKRRKRSIYHDPRQTAELEKRLQLFFEVQDFIAKTGSTDFAEEMGEALLRCQKHSERRNKCLERVACEYADDTSAMDLPERRIAKMVLQNVMSNPMVPSSIKGRLSKGSMFGKRHRGRCKNYWCEALDDSKIKS